MKEENGKVNLCVCVGGILPPLRQQKEKKEPSNWWDALYSIIYFKNVIFIIVFIFNGHMDSQKWRGLARNVYGGQAVFDRKGEAGDEKRHRERWGAARGSRSEGEKAAFVPIGPECKDPASVWKRANSEAAPESALLLESDS